ncbi:MAG: FtsX-like permease family protein [Candidatus Cyclobacteriaceae bacterium M2_1C_046]
MLKHNLLLIFRNYKRFRSTFLINLIGLSTGIACTLMIYLWVNDELSFDNHYQNKNRLYQVMENQSLSTGLHTQEATPDLLGETMAKELAEVEYACGVTPSGWFDKFLLKANEKEVNSVGQFAGKNFFNVFPHEMLFGNPDEALLEANHIAISESLAKNLFGSVEESYGQVIEWELQHLKVPTKVTAVFQDVPKNVTMEYEFVLSFESWKEIISEARELNWDNHGPHTFVLLKENVDKEAFDQKIHGFIKEKLPSSNATLFTQKYSDRYLYNEFENGQQSGGRIEYVKLFSIIAIAILLIACINFMNLSTAKASTRMKEVGVKKSIGAKRSGIVGQHLGESLFLAFISLFFAFILVELFLPMFNQLTGKNINLYYNWQIILTCLAIVIVTGILAGSYPAFYLSSFKPATVLKGKLNTSTGELWTRKGLVIIQFTISITLILSVLVVYSQVKYLLNKDLGYDNENIVFFQKDSKISRNTSTFIDRIKQLENVQNAAGSQNIMIGSHGSTEGLSWKGKDPEENIRFEKIFVGKDLIETMGFKIKSGRSFSPDFLSDSLNIIVNEAAVEIMGLQEPVGEEVILWGNKVTIVGVVKDFNYQTLHNEVQPAFFKIVTPEHLNYMVVRIKPGKTEEALRQIEEVYSEYNSAGILEYQFLDQTYQAQYQSEKRITALARFFAGIAVMISCLGLFGLVSFTAERRRKEIGIRKVLGSGEWSIIALLTKDFTKIILVAIVIALPLGYFIVSDWLGQYAYRITLSPIYFIGAGMIAILIAWLTIGSQALSAARIKPTECLKEN